MAETKRTKHTVNGDQNNGWYCYACNFSTRNVDEAAAHDGTYSVEPAKKVTASDALSIALWP